MIAEQYRSFVFEVTVMLLVRNFTYTAKNLN